MNALSLLSELRVRGIQLSALDNGNLSVEPKEHLTPELISVIRTNKPYLLKSLHAEEALARLARLKGYTLPGGKIVEARELIVQRARELIIWDDGEPVSERSGAAAIIAILKSIESDLIALGGVFDQELAGAIGTVESVFPDAHLIGLRERPNTGGANVGRLIKAPQR